MSGFILAIFLHMFINPCYLLHCSSQCMKRNLFKMLSLNARGIRSFEKRKVLFHWLAKDKPDIIFLQETYSTPEVENIWKSQWRGDIHFSHGLEHSRGVMILVKAGFDCEFKVCCEDTQVDSLYSKALFRVMSLSLPIFMHQIELMINVFSLKKFKLILMIWK